MVEAVAGSPSPALARPSPADATGASWHLALRLARRELRGGLKGFRIFLVCLMLGVTIIAGVGSVGESVQAGIAADARKLLGGDLEARLLYTPATPEQRALMERLGAVSEVRNMRTMAIRTTPPADASATDRTLVELKAVDAAYPLLGTVELMPAMALADALAQRDGRWGAVAEQSLLDRLGLKVGEAIRVGSLDYALRASIVREPDRGGDMFQLGPRLMVAGPSLDAAGLIQPGSLIYNAYRLRLPEGASADDATEALKTQFPDAGWRIRGLEDASPRVQRFIDRTGLFLTLVGLSALLVGGVGVGNAVRSYLEGKIGTIATLKCVGAPAPLIFRLYLTLILALALAGIAAGLVLGGLAPFAVAGALSDGYGLSMQLGLYVRPLLLAAAFGLLVAFAFTLAPLTRARDIPAASLFRDLVSRTRRWPRWQDAALMAGAAAALAALTILSAGDRMLALFFVAGVVGALAIFRLLAALIMLAARSLNRPPRAYRLRPGLRLALANLTRPGAPTGSVVLSLGLGLTVLVAVALVQGNLAREIQETLPETAPSFYFLDIQPDQAAPFETLVRGFSGVTTVDRVPMLRGRISAINGTPADKLSPPEEFAWVLQGDRGVTWSATLPKGNRLTEGEWWPADYKGPLLISLDADIAHGLGVKIGDTVTINLIGRAITGTVANLRVVDWRDLAINFVMVYSPGVLEGAPQTQLATARVAPEQELALQKAVTERFANVSAIRVKDALQSVAEIMTAVGTAIQATAAVTLLAGVLVLAGAVVAGHHRRVYEAVVLKVLGATRADVARAFLLEHGLLGLVTALIAAALGTLVAWFFLTGLTETRFVFLPWVVAGTAALSTLITLLIGFAGTWRALGAKAAPLLRNE
jgi:putative ABC transport system permease protein